MSLSSGVALPLTKAAAAEAAPLPGPMAPVVSVNDRICSIVLLRVLILWSIPLLTFYLCCSTTLLVRHPHAPPRRVQVLEPLLKAYGAHDRDSGQKIEETDIAQEQNHPSVGTPVENLLTRPTARTRQLMQVGTPPPPADPPPAPPPVDEDPDPYIGLGPIVSTDLTVDNTTMPIINGPTQVTIQNVSIYLTGVLFNNFSILPPPSYTGANSSEYEVVLQVDSGSMLIYIPPELLPTVKHQVAVGNFWIAIPNDEWDITVNQWVPGAGIQFQCTYDMCNAALGTLSYGKGLGTGRKSKTVFTILVYPTVDGEPATVAKAIKSCTMDIAGAGAWFTIFQYTKVFYTTSLGVLGLGFAFLIMLCCILGCCVCWQNRKERSFSKRQVIVKVEDALYDETRVFNPFWIPSAAVSAGDNKFVITPNPKFLQQLQSEHLTRMQSIGKDGTLEVMQFLVAAQAAEAASPYASSTTYDEIGGSGEESSTATETTAIVGSSFGSSGSRSSRTSGTSRTSKSTQFSLEGSGTTAETDESAASESDDSDH